MQIGLYGHKALDGLRRSEYEQLLLSLQRKDAVGDAAVEISVIVEIGGGHRHLEVRREWRRKSDGLTEELSIFEGGSKDLDFSQTWDEFIGSILPAELVQLFLFDGEKIEALANPERLPDLLRRATEVFLGIGGIDALGNDLRALERRAALKHKGNSAEFASARNGLGEWEAQVKNLEDKVQKLVQDHAAAKNDADRAQLELDKFTNDAQRRGLSAYEQAAVIRSAVVVSKNKVDSARAALAEIMSDPVLPIEWLSKLWVQYHEVWEQNQHARHFKLLGQEFKKRDQRVLAALTKVAAPKATVEALRRVFADDLQAYTRKRSAQALPLQDAYPGDVERHLSDGKSRLRSELARLQSAQLELDKAEERIGQIPAEEQIADILNSLQKQSKLASSAEARLSNIRERLEEAQSSLSHARVRLNAAQERLGTEFRDRSLETKSLDASARARRALMIFKDRLLASKAQWLSEMITTEFRNLLRKRNLISKVVVDPTTYRVFIEDGKHQELPMDRLSAGERQLLAIAVLSALIKERKGRFPVVVDTPLARLDQQHRAALIKRFFATVSHQVVVLSTDQEVDGPAYEALKPFTNAEYTLHYDDSVGRTSINTAQSTEVA
ncbi:hypothetical protein P609_12775 [Comamonas thiooxydans]|nr:hypothetical protein P609_12775 [Comamonas thiooxydans]